MAAHGDPHVQVVAASAARWPRTLVVRGEPLRTRLSRQCGHDVAVVVG